MSGKNKTCEKSISELGFVPQKFAHEKNSPELRIKIDQISTKKYILNALKMLKRQEFCDVKIIIGVNVFNCHMVVLKSYSAYFKHLDDHCRDDQDSIELPEKEVSPYAFQTIYSWMLDDQATVGRTKFAEVLKAACFLRVDSMKNQYFCCIDNITLFNERFAFSLFLEAKRSDFPLIKKVMLRRISKVFLSVVASREFVELSFEEVRELLKSNYLAVNSELDILQATIRWLQHDWNQRRNFTMDLLKCVRFGLIPSWQIVEYKNCPQQLKHIFKGEDVTQYLIEALSYISVKIYESQNNQESIEFNEEDSKKEIVFKHLNIKEQIPRKIIRDPLYEEFKFEKNSNVYENYYNFLRYLQIIQKCGSNHLKLIN